MNYVGNKYNYLTIINQRTTNRVLYADCICDCGNEYTTQLHNVVRGAVKSCGCMKLKLLSEANKKHGMHGDKLYKVWASMKSRCNNKKNEYYGARGISVCDEWSNDFMAFRKWALENGYDYSLTQTEQSIDRIDVNGNYEPGNCRFTNAKVQRENQRERKKGFEYKGKMYYMYELCEMFDTSEPTLKYRMKKMGMTLEEALETPKKTLGRPRIV